MSENPHQPKEYDAVLGGQTLPPVDSVVLGRIEGIRQRFTNGNLSQKIEALANALNYQDAGIELLIKALSDPVLTVRVTAGNYLQKIDDERARLATVNGITINQGDRIYSVYESYLDHPDHNRSYYELLGSLEDIKARYPKFTPKLISRHIFKAKAEAAALLHHNWRALQDDLSFYFPRRHWHESNGLRDSLSIVDWCKNNNILIRLPGESRVEFEQRCYIDDSANLKLSEADRLIYEERLKEELNLQPTWSYIKQQAMMRKFEQRCFPNTSAKLKLPEEYRLIYQEWFREKPDVEIYRDVLEERVIENLQASQRYELLGQLWLECVGSLAFVCEEIVSQQSYIEVTEML